MIRPFTCPACGATFALSARDKAEADRIAELRYARRLGPRRWRARTEYVCQDCAERVGAQGVLTLGETA